MASFDGVILAGGASRRMGRDKALVEVNGRPMAMIAADALRTAGATSIEVVGGDAEALGRLGLVVVPDRWPGEGPLGGLVTGLDRPGQSRVVVLACDHPSTEGPAVTAVVDGLADADVALPVVAGRRQYLHGAWNRRVADRLREAFVSGERAIHRALGGLEVVEVLEVSPGWYADADRPEDLRH